MACFRSTKLGSRACGCTGPKGFLLSVREPQRTQGAASLSGLLAGDPNPPVLLHFCAISRQNNLGELRTRSAFHWVGASSTSTHRDASKLEFCPSRGGPLPPFAPIVQRHRRGVRGRGLRRGHGQGGSVRLHWGWVPENERTSMCQVEATPLK